LKTFLAAFESDSKFDSHSSDDDYQTDRNTTFAKSPPTDDNFSDMQEQKLEIWDFGAIISNLDPTNIEVVQTIRL